MPPDKAIYHIADAAFWIMGCLILILITINLWIKAWEIKEREHHSWFARSYDFVASYICFILFLAAVYGDILMLLLGLREFVVACRM